MFEYKITTIALLLFILMQNTDNSYSENAKVPRIIVNNLDINDERVHLCYEIKNNTKYDIWTYEGIGKYDIGAEVFMEQDNQTLLIRSRLDIPTEPTISTPSFDGRYIRLAPGLSLSESVSLPVPIRPYYGFLGWSEESGILYAKHLTLEIGYYVGDLREIIRSRLKKEKMSNQRISSTTPYDPNKLINHFAGKGVLIFNEMNEGLRSRKEEVLIPYTDRLFKGEQSLRITIDDLNIPYVKQENKAKGPERPNLRSCTKIEIQYQPSMLEYFFPYDNQQSLLSPEEMHYLKNDRKIVLEEKKDIEAIISDIGNSEPMHYFVIRKRTVANVICYNRNGSIISIPIYNNGHCLLGSETNIFESSTDFQSLKVVTPFINKIQMRIDCANNLTNIWHRFQLHSEAEKNRTKDSSGNDEIEYPLAEKWCDIMLLTYKSIGQLDYWICKPLICPAKSNDSKCCYAMNPSCNPDAPPDMVLLFETKAGWNQHGGPELFTFDNHDPKGGCVLLNDGTVKFIRTKEELQQLRWK